MSAADDLIRQWKAMVDDFQAAYPPEAWALTRLVDGRWEVVDRGETPHGFTTGERFFQMPMPPMEVGDRFLFREKAYEFTADRQLVDVRASDEGTERG